MFKAKTLGTITLSVFAVTFLYQVFSKALTNQGGEFKKYAEESEANLRRVEKAFADAESRRAATESLSTHNSTPEANPNKSSSFRFPQSSCGDKPTGGDDTWYPVFIDGADLDNVRAIYCADAVTTTRSDTGVKTVQVASLTSRDRALELAEAVGGDVGKPTLVQSNVIKVETYKPLEQSEQLPSELQDREAEIDQTKTEAVNLCYEEYAKFQQEANKLRESMLGIQENIVSDFVNDTVKAKETVAKAELEVCLTKAQVQN